MPSSLASSHMLGKDVCLTLEKLTRENNRGERGSKESREGRDSRGHGCHDGRQQIGKPSLGLLKRPEENRNAQ